MSYLTLPLLLSWSCADPKLPDGPPVADGDSLPADSSAPGLESSDSSDSGGGADTTRWSGEAVNEGLGWALLSAGQDLYASAPWGDRGRVYRLSEGGDLELLWEGERAGGSSLARVDDAIYIGSPLEGVGGAVHELGAGLYAEGSEGELLGSLLYGGESLWIGDGIGGLYGEEELSFSGRPRALTRWGDELVALLDAGALLLEGSTLALERGEESSSSYGSLCSSDLNQDGDLDLVLGLPQHNELVYFLGTETPELNEGVTIAGPAGRWGASLACREGAVAVGSPAWGEALEGAAWLLEWRDGALVLPEDPLLSGEEEQARLGVQLIWTEEDDLVISAPGGSASAGRIYRLLSGEPQPLP